MKDTVGEAIGLLKSALLNDTSEICFSRFLKVIDENAIGRSDTFCGIHPWGIPGYYTEYCSSKPTQFVVFYYIEFALIRRTKISSDSVIENIEIESLRKNENLDSSDYNSILKFYIDWFEQGNYKTKRKTNLRK